MYILRALVFLFLAQAVLAEQPTPILPDPKLTPGDTFDVTAQDVCVPGCRPWTFIHMRANFIALERWGAKNFEKPFSLPFPSRKGVRGKPVFPAAADIFPGAGLYPYPVPPRSRRFPPR